MVDTATTMTFTKKPAPDWLLAFWKEIDEKTFGKGFDCFTEDAVCNLGIADWHGREAIRENLRAFIDTGFTALHNVVEYLGRRIAEGVPWHRDNDARRSHQAGREAGHDALLLHGRGRSDQGASLVRFGGTCRILTHLVPALCLAGPAWIGCPIHPRPHRKIFDAKSRRRKQRYVALGRSEDGTREVQIQ